MTSAFDPQSFLDATTTSADERRNPLPEQNPADSNGLYTAVIGEITMDSGEIKKGERVGQPWMCYVVPLTIDVPAQVQAEAKLGPTLKFTDRIFIDLTPSGSIDEAPGKNRSRKAYRDATGQNVAGQPFSIRMLQGKVVKLQVKHEMYENAIQEKIAGVFPA